MSARQRSTLQTSRRSIGLLLLFVGCLRSGQPVVPPPPMGRPTDAAQASLLHADAVKRALVQIEARCTLDRVSGTGFVVDVSRYGLTRDAQSPRLDEAEGAVADADERAAGRAPPTLASAHTAAWRVKGLRVRPHNPKTEAHVAKRGLVADALRNAGVRRLEEP